MNQEFDDEVALLVNQAEVARDIYEALVAKGYVPSSDEVFDISDVVIDLAIDICMELVNIIVGDE